MFKGKDDIFAARQYGAEVMEKYGHGHFKSFVVRFCGARGSGKSLLLAEAVARDLIQGRKVWSNMPVVVTEDVIMWASRRWPKDEQRRVLKKSAGYLGLQTLPLDWDAFYTLSEDLVQGTVAIDEAQYFSDARSALSLKNRLLNAIVAQVRKRNLNLYYTVKQGDWVDKRLTYETDIQIDCSDMSHTPWGRDRGMPSGEMILTRWWDLSGAVTGKAVDFKDKGWQRPYKEGYFYHMHMFWNCYDTSKAVSLEEAFTSVKLDLRQRTITNKQSAEDTGAALYQVAATLRSRGTDEIETKQFQNIANQMGIEGNMQHLGRFLRDMGITRKQKHGGQYFYDLTSLQ